MVREKEIKSLSNVSGSTIECGEEGTVCYVGRKKMQMVVFHCGGKGKGKKKRREAMEEESKRRKKKLRNTSFQKLRLKNRAYPRRSGGELAEE